MKQLATGRLTGPLLGVVVATLSLTGASGQTPTKVVYVASNGVDSALCGETRAPCRSIRQAIANANEGDLIMVGPGRYGDVNRNGVFGEPGEEGGAASCGCLIQVDKALRVVSRDGAATTVLDATGAPNMTVVRIVANDVVFGRLHRGFTLRGGINPWLFK